MVEVYGHSRPTAVGYIPCGYRTLVVAAPVLLRVAARGVAVGTVFMLGVGPAVGSPDRPHSHVGGAIYQSCFLTVSHIGSIFREYGGV